MSYSVHIYRREVEAKYKAADRPDFFEDPSNLVPFTKRDVKRLTEALELRGWAPTSKSSRGEIFSNAEFGTQALLTTGGLYFMEASGEDAIFDISMFASELAGTDFAKFDPQDGAWE